MRFTRAMLEYFRQQGELGATKRNQNLRPEQRTEIAKKAAKARWAKETATSQKKRGVKPRGRKKPLQEKMQRL